MSLKLTVLGSGTMMPTKTRHPAGYLVETTDNKILLDCGHTTIGRLVDLGYNLHDINIISISHFHTDHFSDFMAFIHARWVDDLQNGTPHRRLAVFAPKGFKDRWLYFRKIFWSEPDEKYPFEIFEGPTKWQLVQTFPINHVHYYVAQGTKIIYEGKTVAYTGDVGSDEPMGRLAANVKNADLLIIECGATKPSSNHYTIEQIIELKKKANTKQVLVTHVRDQNLAHIKKAIKDNPTISIAKDKQVIDL